MEEDEDLMMKMMIYDDEKVERKREIWREDLKMIIMIKSQWNDGLNWSLSITVEIHGQIHGRVSSRVTQKTRRMHARETHNTLFRVKYTVMFTPVYIGV